MAFWLHKECVLIFKKKEHTGYKEKHNQYHIFYCPEITTTNSINLSKKTCTGREGLVNATDGLYPLLKSC